MVFSAKLKQRHIKRLVAALLAAVFMLNAIPHASAADTYYYGVVGKTLFPCTYNYMPMMTSDGLMCPVQLLLDGDLGFNYIYAPAEGHYTLYRDGRYLVFYLNRPGSFDIYWLYEDKSLLKQNGTFYVPLQHVAERFGLNLNDSLPSAYGNVVRISSLSETTSDDNMLHSINSQLSRAQDKYRAINGIAAPEPQKPAPTVYLGFDANADNDVSGILDVLDAHKITATFFVSPEFAERGDVRSIIVKGHTIGIRLDNGDDLETLSNANQALRFSALTQTRILRLSGEADDETREALESGGYRPWVWKLDWQNKNLFKEIDNAKVACYVRFGCDEASAEALVELLDRLKPLEAEYYAINEAQPPVMS